MIEYTMENTEEAINELYIAGLFDMNYIEADPRASTTDFKLNLEMAYQLLSAGMLKVHVAREEDGTPVGFFIYMLAFEDLFTSSCVASSVCTYVVHKHRGGTVFPKLVKEAEKSAKEFGAKHLYVGVSPESVNMQRLGYSVDNINFSKELEE